MMKRRYYIFLIPLFVLVAMLIAACSSDSEVETDNQQPLPEGTGRICIAICTPEQAQTRAVNANPWEDPDHDWETLQTFRILICDASNSVVDIISGDYNDMEVVEGTTSTYKRSGVLRSNPLAAGSYKIYATANFDDGYTVGSVIDLEKTVKYTNGYSASSAESFDEGKVPFGVQKNIPMTGQLASTVTVTNGNETNAGIIKVWRVMGKMQFYFTNEAESPVRIIGVEVEPINLASSDGPGIYLFSKDDLESINNLAPGATPPTGKEGITLPPKGTNAKSAREDVGTFRYQPTTIPLTLAAKNDGNTDEGTLFFYVNESDATFTTTNNQYSLRFKVQRLKAGKTGDNADDWYEQEIRYGVTTHHDLTNDGTYGGYNGGFNVIRRNDWIHIPIHLTDWQFRVEPLAFVPIAGYPAATLSSDALTATFSTGGMVALQPFVKKYNDNSWRDFSNSEITFKPNLPPSDAVGSIHWKNINGEDVSGAGKIVKTPFIYDDDLKCIIGELNNDLTGGPYKTTFTVSVRLDEYDYTFTFNIILGSSNS